MSTTNHASTREVFEEVQRRLLALDIEGFVDLFAVDGAIERPFAAPGVPRRVQGREEIRASMMPRARYLVESGLRIERFDSLVVHETTDPEVVIAEFDQDLAVGGSTHRLSLVQVVRVRDGEIVLFRDYVDPLASAAAVGGLPALIEAIGAEAPA
jgi:ketosteroid isomerase-like protein